jgi:hypothetical protein
VGKPRPTLAAFEVGSRSIYKEDIGSTENESEHVDFFKRVPPSVAITI